MPKIVIKEYDKTKAIANEYANFAVVVPGPVGDKSDLTVFDDNGIYECSSEADFVEKIGLQANVAATEEAIPGTGIAATPAEASQVDRITTEKDPSVPSGYYKIAKDIVVYTKSQEAGEAKAGKYQYSWGCPCVYLPFVKGTSVD